MHQRKPIKSQPHFNLLPPAKRIALLCCMGLPLSAALTPVLAEQYDSLGKRDPFVTLTRSAPVEALEVVPPPPLANRPPGLAGLLVSEVSVAGMASNSSQDLVILKGVDNFTYFASKGSKLFDGYLEDIMGEKIVFKREVQYTRGDKKIYTVVKSVYTEEK